MVAFEVSPLFHDVVKAPNGMDMELFQDSSFLHVVNTQGCHCFFCTHENAALSAEHNWEELNLITLM